jgi:hypothetical protein
MKSARLVGISTISNHPVAGSIIVRHQKLRESIDASFLVPYSKGIAKAPIRSTHRVCQGISSGFLLWRNLGIVLAVVLERPADLAACLADLDTHWL